MRFPQDVRRISPNHCVTLREMGADSVPVQLKMMKKIMFLFVLIIV